MDEMIEKIAEWFLGYLLWEKDMDYPDFWVDTREEVKEDYRNVARSLLSLETEDCRLAVVRDIDCRDGYTHYCPNCDKSMNGVVQEVK